MNKNSGVALVIVLLIVSILVVVVLEFNYASRVNAAVFRAQHGKAQAVYLAKGGVNFARSLLEADNKRFDSLLEEWTDIPPVFTGNGSFKVKVIDEERFINVNNLLSTNDKIRKGTEDAVSNLLILLDAEPGFQADLYGKLPLRTKDGLPKYLTVFPRRGGARININTAPGIVLQSLSSDIGLEMIDAIINYREGLPFRSTAQLRSIVGRDIFEQIKDIITVRSATFTIVSRARVGRYQQKIVAVIRRGATPAVRYWKVI